MSSPSNVVLVIKAAALRVRDAEQIQVDSMTLSKLSTFSQAISSCTIVMNRHTNISMITPSAST